MNGVHAEACIRTPAESSPDLYTDATQMRTLLQQLLPGFAEGRLRIDALGVAKARRNTSLRRNPVPITLCYELRVTESASGRAGTQTLYAKVFRAGLAEAFFHHQSRSRLVAPAFGEPLVHLPALNMVLWALPNDPGLPQLATLLDPARADALLPWATLHDSHSVARADVGEFRAELLRHEPERRATLRYTLARAGAEPLELYAKTFFDGRAQLLQERFDHFWRLSQADGGAPLVAQPLGCCAATQTLWQAPALGMPLLYAMGGGDGPALMQRVARALALLHAAPLVPAPGATPRSAAHWVAEARRRQTKIGRADPFLAARAASVADTITAHADYPASRPLSLIHGDFHPDQIWVHQGRVVLFDFDEFTLGDPMEDLAEFVLKLELAGASPSLSAVLIEHYAACAPERFDERSLNWHLAVQSLLQTSRAFVFQQPGWADRLARHLAACEARAAALNLESCA